MRFLHDKGVRTESDGYDLWRLETRNEMEITATDSREEMQRVQCPCRM